MYSIKQLFKTTLFAGLALAAVSCSKDKGTDTPAPGSGDHVYALGLGIDGTGGTTNYVAQASDLMSGTINAKAALLQTGYRDYAFGGSTFFSIGGLGVTDANAITLGSDNKLTSKTGLTFETDNSELVNVDANTMVGASFPSSSTVGLNAKFYTLNIASNTLSNKAEVPMNKLFSKDWLFYTGMQVRGNQLFQTFYPVNQTTYATLYTDTNYVAVYSYPGFVLQKVIKDTRTGPSGAFNTRSGIVQTESGDLYTISNSSFANGYSQSTKPAGILRIKAGATDFDPTYFFNTDTAPNGGKIAHAKYIGNGLIFAAITTQVPVLADRWSDNYLRLAIINLTNNTITLVANAPVFKGNGGRSFAALLDGGKVYTALSSGGVVNIYQVDVASATAVKGAVVEATFVGGIAKMK